jgi:nucleoside recognition membrane protein YjiH
MKTYFIIFVVIFSIAFIAGVINHIAEKHSPKSFTANISSLIANGFGIIVVFMFFGGLLCIC